MYNQDILIIGIAGASGSGKTTLAKELSARFGDQVILLSHDNYYKCRDDIPLEERNKINYDEPNALETELLIDHLKQLRMGKTIFRPTYDFKTHNRTDEMVRVDPRRVIIVEGILVFENKELRDMMDLRVFVDTDQDICLARRIRRDVHRRHRTMESVLDAHMETVRPMYDLHVAPTKAFANIIVPGGGKDRAVQQLLADRVSCFLCCDVIVEGEA